MHLQGLSLILHLKLKQNINHCTFAVTGRIVMYRYYKIPFSPPTSLLCCHGVVKPLSHKSSNDCLNMTGHSMPFQGARFLCSAQHSPASDLRGCHHHSQAAVCASNYRVNKTEKIMNKHFDLSHERNRTGVDFTMTCLVMGPSPTMQS